MSEAFRPFAELLAQLVAELADLAARRGEGLFEALDLAVDLVGHEVLARDAAPSLS